MKSATRLMIATAALTAATVFHVPASFAYGDAPWCAVVNLGTGEMHWDCSYRTAEECAPNVIAGNRGFCNLNPYGPGPGWTPRPVASSRHKKHRVQ
jgi:hypothetical protein